MVSCFVATYNIHIHYWLLLKYRLTFLRVLEVFDELLENFIAVGKMLGSRPNKRKL